ncbi:DUF6164 family protein [Xanthomonadaceae bacterium JHOS43]|nr:DUF6164 family protein [Xanthomonadaceae bacterium JHOS43]MCX7563392.1 DUF6164 family protein [Xanthomonadaceae bacterium XH05]
MSRLLFNLRQVPDDEADEVRALLHERGIGFYETQAGRWNLSLPGLWVEDTDYIAARTLLDAYQVDRRDRARAERVEIRERGQAPGVVDNIRQNPVRVVLALAVIVGLLLLMMWPYLGW